MDHIWLQKWFHLYILFSWSFEQPRHRSSENYAWHGYWDVRLSVHESEIGELGRNSQTSDWVCRWFSCRSQLREAPSRCETARLRNMQEWCRQRLTQSVPVLGSEHQTIGQVSSNIKCKSSCSRLPLVYWASHYNGQFWSCRWKFIAGYYCQVPGWCDELLLAQTQTASNHLIKWSIYNPWYRSFLGIVTRQPYLHGWVEW